MLQTPLHPETYPRRALVAALGLAPQVVTETLWALAVQHNFVPTEIHLITTMAGQARAEAVLMGPEGSLATLAADIGMPAIAAVPLKIHLIGGQDRLTDLDSLNDNLAAADLFASVIGGLANDPELAMHVSLAGGRKTMGFLAGYAVSLFGRPQDRLSHVLVQLPFQNMVDFHFPPKVPREFVDAAGNIHSSVDCGLVLADIPFVCLRSGQPKAFLSGGLSFSKAVENAQKAFQPPSLVIDVQARLFICHGIKVPLTPYKFAFALWLAERKRDKAESEAGVRWDDGLWPELAEIHHRLGLDPPPHIDKNRPGNLDIAAEYITQNISKIRSAIDRALGGQAQPYRPVKLGKRSVGRITFALEAACIHIR
jgi:CRISPR-associated protein (TIGR02584 family)